MSASFSQKKIVTSNKVAAKPFCKVCHDAGKTEAVYTSHFVKSEPGSKGKVVCPTLLSQGCSYCHEPGHTVSYCQVLKQNDKNKEKAQRAVVYHKESAVAVKKTVTKAKGFAALGLLDEEADKIEEQELQVQAAYPVLGNAQAQVQAKVQAPAQSYASMASKSPENKTVTKNRAIVVHNVDRKRRWADWSESDDDADDDEDEYDF